MTVKFPNMDVATILAAAAFVSSVVAPCIVAVINNKHQQKMFKLEHYQERRDVVFREFIGIVGKLASQTERYSHRDFDTLYRITGEMYLYTPKSQWAFIDAVADYIQGSSDLDKIKKGYIDFCKCMSDTHCNN